MNLADAIATGCAGLAGISIVYWLITTAWLSKWRKESPDEGIEDLPPITFLRPLKPHVPGLDAELCRFLQELRAGDQVIFGVEQGSPEERLCDSLQESGKEHITVVPCAPGAALNPKISKLVQMAPHARHSVWIVLDAEFVAETGWLDRFRADWATGGADAMTASYGFSDAESFVQRLDALPVLTTLLPGLAVIRRSGSLQPMLGAVIAVRRDAVEQIGGWQALGNYLADDNRLGATLASAGKRVGLSRQIATLTADPLSWRGYWQHQRRVAVTYRACNPLGFAGSVFVQGVPFALLAFCLKPGSLAFQSTLLLTLLVRISTVRSLSRSLSFPLRPPFLGVIISSFVEIACWLLAWLSPRICWAGRRYRVTAGGLIESDDQSPRSKHGC